MMPAMELRFIVGRVLNGLNAAVKAFFHFFSN